MNCKEARKWISPYLDSELGQTKTFEVSEHLRKCPGCETRFEREREVDGQIRTRLQNVNMPAELWMRINRDVSAPWWVRGVRGRRMLAMAACLAVVLLGTQIFRHDTARPRVLGEFLALRPDNQPFGLETGAPSIDLNAALAGAELTVPVALMPTSAQAAGHQLEVFDVVTRTDARGRGYVEVRLNCCGQPVLLVLAEPRDGHWPEAFDGLPRGGGTMAESFDGVNIATIDLGGVRAVAVSRHSVTDLIAGLHVNTA